jgi:hypothetical protein
MKKEEALALWRASPGTVLASWEVNPKGARDYSVKSVDEWIGDMTKESTNLVFHECIHPTLPCRIYGDIDIKRGEPGFDQPEAVLDAILEKVERAIRDTLHVAVPPPSCWMPPHGKVLGALFVRCMDGEPVPRVRLIAAVLAVGWLG